VSTVLLVTCDDLASGEPGAPALDAVLAERGIDARWVSWDDAGVDWAAADLVAVRSTWDYVARHVAFVDWAREVGSRTRLLNGPDVFAWNVDKAYLAGLGDGLPVVPTALASDRDQIADGVRRFGSAVVKSRIGAGGIGVVVAEEPDDPRLAGLAEGPWVVQPLVEAVRTEGETSVFVIDGRAVSQVDKLPAADEIRVHEEYGGSYRAVPLRDEAADVARRGIGAAERVLGVPLDYGRVDMMRLADGRLAVSELELTEPGLYLDVAPENAEPFADLVAARLG
jgi:glutathione synthase/RimK-type ligase-like ATP-grasp enzyme